MRNIIITRLGTSDEGTWGSLLTDSGFKCVTIELPWRNNQQGKSCIPAGTYPLNWRFSKKHGNCYHVDQVSNRSDIEIHAANWAGDANKGFKCQLLGCIAPGEDINYLEGQLAAISSHKALINLELDLLQKEAELEIRWSVGTI